jgi:hypothetical protein
MALALACCKNSANRYPRISYHQHPDTPSLLPRLAVYDNIDTIQIRIYATNVKKNLNPTITGFFGSNAATAFPGTAELGNYDNHELRQEDSSFTSVHFLAPEPNQGYSIGDFDAEMLRTSALGPTMSFFQSSLTNVWITNLRGDLSSRNTTIDSLTLLEDSLNTISLENSTLKSLLFERVVIKRSSINSSELPQNIRLIDVSFVGQNDFLDLTEFQNINGKECLIQIKNTSLNNIRLNYRNFKLYFPNVIGDKEPAALKEYTLTQLLENQRRNGFLDGYEKVDKEFKKYHYLKGNLASGRFLNWLDSNWWDYGYNKSLIVRNGIILMIFFFVLNLLCFKFLVFKTYILTEFVEAYKRVQSRNSKRSLWRHFKLGIYCLIYTAFIFWGLRIDLTKLKLQNIPAVILILSQYLMGLVCLGYLANYILTH